MPGLIYNALREMDVPPFPSSYTPLNGEVLEYAVTHRRPIALYGQIIPSTALCGGDQCGSTAPIRPHSRLQPSARP